MAAIFEKSCDIARKMQEYLTRVEKNAAGLDPVLLDTFSQHLSAIEGAEPPAQITNNNVKLDILFNFGALISTQINHVREAYDILATRNPSVIGNRATDGSAYSSVFLTDVADLWHAVEVSYNELMTGELSPWRQFLRPLTTIDQLDEALKLSNKSVDVYVALIEVTLATKLDEPVLKRVWHDLEILKTAVLVNAVDLPKQEPPCNVVQQLIQRYNLGPDAPVRPWAEIAVMLGLTKSGEPSADTFKTAAKLLGVGLLIINKCIHKSPIEHNLWTVLGPPTNRMIGVCAENIKSTQTIRMLTAAKTTLPPILIVPENAATYYVLETLDGANWRFMLPWAAVAGKPAPIPADWLPLKNMPSHRLTAYNILINDEIMKHVGPQLINDQISREDMKIAEGHWANVRNMLVQKIVDHIMKHGVGRAIAAVKDDNTYSYILMIIAREVTLPNMPADKSQAELVLREIAITYYSDYSKLHADLKTNALELLGDGPKRGNEREFFSTMFNSLLERFISRKSNIYDEIERKISLLKTVNN